MNGGATMPGMRALLIALVAVSLLTAADPVELIPHVIEDDMPGGYSVIVVDVNADGRLDVLGMTQRVNELAWYENPTWERHVIVSGRDRMVNLAAHDVDGDGVPEIAIQDAFSMVAADSPGYVWLLEHDGDPRRPWKVHPVDQLITSHHIAWADVDGDGRKELINAPLIGPDAVKPKYDDDVPLVYYPVPEDFAGAWERHVIDDSLHGVLHRVRVVQWDDDPAEELLTTSFLGITLHDLTADGWRNTRLSRGHKEEPETAGASDVAVGSLGGRRILTAVEPWHGNEVVVYTGGGSEGWERNVIYDRLTEGHEICTGDFNGDGLDDIAVGDRARGKVSTSHVFYAEDAAGAAWRHEELDPLGMSASGCAVADLNADGRPDLVQIGGATHNIKWYENLGPS